MLVVWIFKEVRHYAVREAI